MLAAGTPDARPVAATDAGAPDAKPPDAAPMQAQCGTLLTKPAEIATHMITDETMLYWAEQDLLGDSTELRSVPKQGGEAKLLASVDGRVIELALQGSDLYVSTRTKDEDVHASRVLRVPVSGTGAQPVVTDEIRGFAVDESSVYWYRWDADARVVKFQRIARDGTGEPQLIGTWDYPLVYSIAVDGDFLYYGQNSGISRIPKAGGWDDWYQPVVNLQITPEQMAFDGANVYWLGGGIMRAKLPATDKWDSGWNLDVKWVARQAYEGDFRVADSKVYFSGYRTGGLYQSLFSAPTSGVGEPTLLLPDRGRIFAVDASGLYFQDFTGIRRAALTGCAP